MTTDAQKGTQRLKSVNGLSHAKAANKWANHADPETNLPVTARTIAKARQGRIPALERLGRAEFVPPKGK